MTSRNVGILVAAVLGGALIGGGRAPAYGGAADGGRAGDAHLRKLVAVGSVKLPSGLGAAEAGKAGAWVRSSLGQRLGREPGILLAGDPRSAQFRADVELARAEHVRTAGGWGAGAALYLRIVDIATGEEIAGERFAATRPAPGPGPDALRQLGKPGAAVAPLPTAVADALGGAAAYTGEQLRPRFWQARVVAVRQGTARNEVTGEVGTYQLVTLSSGANAGLKRGDALHLRRYVPAGEEAGGGKRLEPPLAGLYIVSAEGSSAVARAPREARPQAGDLARWGELISSRALVGTFKTNPPNARRLGDRELAVVASQIQEAVGAMVENYERETQAAPNSFICSGQVARLAGPGSDVQVTVTVEDRRTGKELHTVSRSGPAGTWVNLANQLWLELQDRLQGQVGTRPPIEPSRPGPVDPGYLPVVRQIPSVQWRRPRPDFRVTARMDRPEGAVYRYGEALRLTVESPDTDCYIQVWYINNQLRSYQVFPRDPRGAGNDALRNDPQAGLLRKGEVKQLPPPGARYAVGPPAGEDYLVVLAVRGSRGRQFYPYLAGLMQQEYPPQEEADARDVKLPPRGNVQMAQGTNPRLASVPRSRGLRVTEALQQEERKGDVKPGSSGSQAPPEWLDGSFWASTALSWRTVDPNARFGAMPVPARLRAAWSR